MPDEVDSLILNAEVLDSFSKTLNELSTKLMEIAVLEEAVFPIDGDVDVAGAMAELEVLEKQLDRIDRKDVDVDVGVDSDLLAASAAIERVQARGVAALGDTDSGGGFTSAADRFMLDRRSGSLFSGDRDVDLDPLSMLSDTVADNIRGADIPGGSRRNQWRSALSNFGSLKLTMGVLMNLLASLVPLIGVFVGALPAAIAGLGALTAAALAAAGALIGVVGLGMGAMAFENGQLNVRELQQNIRDVLDTFLESFSPLMEALKPLAQDIFEMAAMAFRDMAMRLRVLTDFTDEARGAFQWMADVAGPVLQEMVMFAEAAAPALAMIVGGIGAIDWFGIFAAVTADVLPLLVTFVGLVMEMLPAIYQMSLGFFQVANAITAFFASIWALLDVFGPLPQILGAFIALVLTSITVTSLWSMATGTLAARVGTLITSLMAHLTAIIMNKAAALGFSISLYTAAAAAATLIGVLTLGLAPVLSTIATHFMGINDQIGNVTNGLRRFSKQANRVDGMGVGVGSGQGYGSSGPQYTSVTNNIEAPDKDTANAAAHTLSWEEETSTTDQTSVDDRNHSG